MYGEDEEKWIKDNPEVYLDELDLKDAPILIWDFQKAPPSLQRLSINGGDEDWLILIKKEIYVNSYINFLNCWAFPDIDVHDIGSGYLVLISSHA